MTGNIVGEEFKEYVFKQIEQRQKDQFAGYDQLRTDQQLQYLTNKTAWVKLASGMEIVEEDGGLERLKSIVGDDNIVNQFRGTELARKTVLFNGTSEIESATYQDGKKVEKVAQSTFRAGYSSDKSIWNFSSAYGLGGPDFGQQPMPGITSVNVKSLNRGSIREANIQIKAYNKFQFALLELLYLRIGFTMMLEWGNDKFINNDGEFQPMGNTIIEDLWFQNNSYTQLQMINDIERYRTIYSGNYDGFFGKVVNFEWTFASDGSYDINLKLITVGDVIESLQANIPVSSADINDIQLTLTGSEDSNNKLYTNLIDTPIVNAAQNNKLGRYLFQTIQETELFKDDPNYFSSLEGVKVIASTTPRKTDRELLKSSNKYYYYMSFGELLKLFQNNIIPGIDLGDNISPLLDIERDEYANKISYFPNQISLDPRVCIFKPVFGDLGEDNPRFRIKGISHPGYLSNLKNYVDQTKGGILYGKLMNIYLNYDFISNSLMSNTKDGKLSVFKFFQKICDGINSALGNFNNIEPIIKDDKIVTFIDQNPIPGYLEEIYKDKKYIVDLEVYGYNPSKKQSNFVKDISFKTSITPQLASMITIGTTAGGSNTKNEDGTAFSSWNEGLRDRFAPKIVDPKDKILKKEKEELQQRIDNLAQIWNQKSSWRPFSGEDNSDDNEYKVFDKSEYGRDKRGITHDAISGTLSIKEFINKSLENDEYLKNNENIISQSELTSEQNNNYAIYLADCFGGETDIKVQSLQRNSRGGGYKVVEKGITVDRSKSKYLRYDSNFISRGKATFKTYINSITKEIYDTPNPNDPKDKSDRTPSNQIGFIPVGFNLTLEGISGIKIYNKLNINNTFLPEQYPKALKFLIQKVDHKIQNNTWETDLDTLSIPNTKQVTVGDLSNLYQSIQYTQTGLLPENERGPIPPTTTKVTFINYQGKSYSSNSNQIADKFINPDAQSSFKSFFQEFVANWDGYVMNINAIGRSIEKSKELKALNSSNADPGRSRHNYYAAVDCNITAPNGEVLLKANPVPWHNHGIVKLAEKHGLVWGGNFSNYVDSVHFGFQFTLDTAIKNAEIKYGSLENMKGDDGKSVKLA
jgi:hypothetical protein